MDDDVGMIDDRRGVIGQDDEPAAVVQLREVPDWDQQAWLDRAARARARAGECLQRWNEWGDRAQALADGLPTVDTVPGGPVTVVRGGVAARDRLADELAELVRVADGIAGAYARLVRQLAYQIREVSQAEGGGRG